MLFFYAYTNANIITMTNLKCNLYPNEQGILLVRGTPSVSYEVLKAVEANEVFDKVLVADMPIINMKTIRFHRTKILKQYVKSKKINNYYTEFLCNNIGKIKCDKIFINGGWNEACYIINYFYRINNAVEVCIVEEGTGIYTLTRKTLLNMRPGLNWKGRIANCLAERKYRTASEKRLSTQVYTYSEKEYRRLNKDNKANPIELPKIDKENPKMQDILIQGVDVGDNKKIIYDKRKIIFLADYLFEDEQEYMINLIIKSIHPSKTIIKTHTSSTIHKLNFAKKIKNVETALYVDRDTYYFEGMNMFVDFSDKVFISRGSAIMLYMKLIYGKEPYLIFTYKLYKDYKNEGDVRRIGDLVDMIRNLYDDKSRIMVPDSMSQFEDMVYYAYIQSLGY